MKFKAGEIAEYCGFKQKYSECNGMQVEIFAVGPFKRGQRINGKRTEYPCDYLVTEPDGLVWSVNEKHLRKRRPPEQPADDEFTSWLSSLSGQGERA